MQLVVISVLLDDKLETPEPKLDPGEYIVTKTVELSKLSVELEGETGFLWICLIIIDMFCRIWQKGMVLTKGTCLLTLSTGFRRWRASFTSRLWLATGTAIKDLEKDDENTVQTKDGEVDSSWRERL